MFISDLFIWTLWQRHLSQTEEILIVVWFTFSWLLGFSTSFSQIHIGHLFVCLFSSLLCISVRDVSVLFHHSFWLVWDCGVSVRPMLVPTLLGLSVSFFCFLIPAPWQLSALQIFPSARRPLKSTHCFLMLFKYSVVGEILPSSLGFFYLMSMGLVQVDPRRSQSPETLLLWCLPVFPYIPFHHLSPSSV